MCIHLLISVLNSWFYILLESVHINYFDVKIISDLTVEQSLANCLLGSLTTLFLRIARYFRFIFVFSIFKILLIYWGDG